MNKKGIATSSVNLPLSVMSIEVAISCVIFDTFDWLVFGFWFLVFGLWFILQTTEAAAASG